MFQKKVKEPTPYELAVEQVRAATRHRDRMRANFENCLPEYFDVADAELRMAEDALNTAIIKVKLMAT